MKDFLQWLEGRFSDVPAAPSPQVPAKDAAQSLRYVANQNWIGRIRPVISRIADTLAQTDGPVDKQTLAQQIKQATPPEYHAELGQMLLDILDTVFDPNHGRDTQSALGDLRQKLG